MNEQENVMVTSEENPVKQNETKVLSKTSGSSIFSVSSDDDSDSDSDQDSAYRRPSGDSSIGSVSDVESSKETRIAGKLRVFVRMIYRRCTTSIII